MKQVPGLIPHSGVSSVSDTARWAAYYRALETRRPDAIFQDPFAEQLAGDVGKNIAAHAPWHVRNGWPVIARTNIIDDFVLAAVAEGCDCVLNLAAGLDTRPYRLPLPESLPWVEADLPGIVEEKARHLAGHVPRCQLIQEAVDLADSEARARFLEKALINRRKALVITEGLLMYLSEEVVSQLARDLARVSVAWWVLETISPPVRDMIMATMKDELANAPMHFAPPNGVAFFEPLGWRVAEVRPVLREARRLRRLPWPLSLAAMHPFSEPDPRNVAHARWSAVVRLKRGEST